MENAAAIKDTILAILAVVGSALANALGGWDAALALLVALMGLDYLTGWAVAAFWQRSPKSSTGALDSKASFRGLVKKGIVLLLVWLGTLLDNALGAAYVRTAVVLFFIGNEGLSLLENLGLMGVPFPDFLQKALEALREQGKSGTTENPHPAEKAKERPGTPSWDPSEADPDPWGADDEKGGGNDADA